MDPWSPSGGGQQARSLRFILPDRSVVIELVKSFRQIHDNEISQSRHNVEADAEKRVLGRRRAAGGVGARRCCVAARFERGERRAGLQAGQLRAALHAEEPLRGLHPACTKIRQLSVAELLAETIRRINDAESVRGRLSFDNGIEMATRRLRDPNAWYHIVLRYDGTKRLDSWTLYINNTYQNL
mgnify:CR=1 FL=1